MYRTAMIALLALMLTGCGRLTGGRDTAYAPASNLIAFSSLDGGISTVRPDGSLLREIAGPEARGSEGFPGVYSWPVWSPDATRVLYSAVLPAGGKAVDVSIRVVPARGGSESVLYTDVQGTSGIGAGIPHYACWSPDGAKLAVIAGTPDGLVGEVVDVATGAHESQVARNAPIFMSWSADSRSILVHNSDFLRRYSFDQDGGQAGPPRQIGGGSTDYYAPEYSPDGGRVLHAQTLFGRTRVTVTVADSYPPEQNLIMDARGHVGFGWSPDGLRIAVLSEVADGLYNRLTVLSPAGSELFRIERENLVSFWWSPDSKKLALVSLTEDASHNTRLAFGAVDVRDGSEMELASILPTDEFLFTQYFFDQYARSMRIWSPDSRSLVLFGALGDNLGQSASYGADSASSRNGVWVIDVTRRSSPRAVGEGTIGAWSPR